jgi:hypothetical protein
MPLKGEGRGCPINSKNPHISLSMKVNFNDIHHVHPFLNIAESYKFMIKCNFFKGQINAQTIDKSYLSVISSILYPVQMI